MGGSWFRFYFNVRSSKFRNYRISKNEIWDSNGLEFNIFRILHSKVLKNDISESWKVEDGHREMMMSPVKNLNKLGYEFHIYQKA